VQEKSSELVAKRGIWKGLHPAMGLASKGMVAAFVVFTALNVEFANSIYSAMRGWIESALNWYYISALVIMLFVCFLSDVQPFRQHQAR
jgi:choline/glycine/proline betaine transport protein